MSNYLEGLKVVSIATNFPGPLACAKLTTLGAHVTKIEPPTGDQLKAAYPHWYQKIHQGQKVKTLDLKGDGFSKLVDDLAGADLFITSSRPKALAKLKLSKKELQERFPHLCVVAITGFDEPHENRPAHDLTSLAGHGLITPPHLPKSLSVDILTAEKVVSMALALFFNRKQTGQGSFEYVSMDSSAATLAEPWKEGATKPDGLLGGALGGYGLYKCQDGWIALAAIEPNFQETLRGEIGQPLERKNIEAFTASKTCQQLKSWAEGLDIPLEIVGDEEKQNGNR